MGMDLGSVSSSFKFSISDFTSKVNEVKAGLNGISEAVQKTNADIGKDAQNGISKSADAMSGSFSTLKDKINSTNNEIRNNTSETNRGLFSEVSSTSTSILSDLNTKMSGFKDKLFSMNTAIKGVILGYAGKSLFDFTIGNASQMEGFMTSFTVMMGSADKAKAKLKELNDYANNTPFKLDEVVQAGKTLMTFGLTTQDWVRNAGNLAAASNVSITDVAMAMGRIKAGDFGEAFERMRDFGISKQMLMGQGLIFDSSGAYKGSVDKALTAVQNIVQSKYGDMTNQQAKTWAGLSSTFEDSITSFGRSIGDKAFPAVKAALTSLMSALDTLNKNGTMDKLATMVGNAMSSIASQIPILVAKLPDIITGFQGVWSAVSPILSFIVTGMVKFGSFCADNVGIAKVAFVAFGSALVALNIASSVGKIVTTFNVLKTAIMGVSVVAPLAEGAVVPAVASMGAAFATALIPILPFIAAAAAIGVAAYAIHKALSTQATPAVDLFANKVVDSSKTVGKGLGVIVTDSASTTVKISDSTKKAVGAYMDMDKNVSKSMLSMNVSSSKLTKAQVDDVEKQFANMGTTIKKGMDARNTTDYNTMKAFLDKSHTLNSVDEKLVLKNINDANKARKGVIDAYNAQISAIYAKALKEHRGVSVDEQTQINKIQSTMATTGVKTLSTSEVESKVILSRLASYGKNITAQQASDVIKNANSQRDGSISAANSQYDKTVAAIVRQRDEAGTITADQADKMIKDAGKQRDQTISAAEAQRNGVVGKVAAMNTEAVNNVDLSNGKMLTSTDKMVAGILADLQSWKNWWDTTVFQPKQMTIVQNTQGTLGPILPPILSSGTKSSTSAKKREYAVGTDNAEGGPSLVGELGPEIRNLKKGDTITTAAETAKLLGAKPADQTKKYLTVGTQITTGLIDGIVKGTPKLIDKTNVLSTGVSKIFTALSKDSNPAGQDIITSLSTGMKNTTVFLNNTTQKLSDGTTKIVNTLIKNSNPLGNNVVTALSTGMKNTTSKLDTTTNALSTGTKNIFTTLAKASNPIGQSVTTSLSNGVKATVGNLNNATNLLSSNAKTTFNKLANDSNPLGKNVTLGLSNGIYASTKNVTSVVKTLTDKVIEQFNTGFDIHSPSKKLFTVGTQVGQGWINGVKSKDLAGFVKKHITSIMGSFSGSGSASSAQLNQWIMAALGITGTPMSWMGPLQQLINFESGGNPNNINLTDSNAKAGHPSQGLMQTIPSTFATYGIAALGGITNPIANIVAGINYIKATYGNISNTPGMRSIAHGGPYMGYVNGTNFATAGYKWVGENGPELMKFNGGETVKTNAESLALANKTTPIINKYDALLHVDTMTLANDMDVQKLSIQLEFYRKKYATAQGGV